MHLSLVPQTTNGGLRDVQSEQRPAEGGRLPATRSSPGIDTICASIATEANFSGAPCPENNSCRSRVIVIHPLVPLLDSPNRIAAAGAAGSRPIDTLDENAPNFIDGNLDCVPSRNFDAIRCHLTHGSGTPALCIVLSRGALSRLPRRAGTGSARRMSFLLRPDHRI